MKKTVDLILNLKNTNSFRKINRAKIQPNHNSLFLYEKQIESISKDNFSNPLQYNSLRSGVFYFLQIKYCKCIPQRQQYVKIRRKLV